MYLSSIQIKFLSKFLDASLEKKFHIHVHISKNIGFVFQKYSDHFQALFLNKSCSSSSIFSCSSTNILYGLSGLFIILYLYIFIVFNLVTCLSFQNSYDIKSYLFKI